MKIKSLQMLGFKSFGDRTELHFDKQIVGVVGPNGCGKSNIVDAIRWVMGEQSAKGLRGNEMSDVIFNGTTTRKKASFAEVSLIFDNADKLASAPYTDVAEIMITRRLYRSGESEYLINKVAVRLKDINDLFLGTGSSARAYSIVAQGKVDQIVLAKPEDRRFLLEEAAGVAKYKVRKTAAERKMDATKLNLERVHDIIKELERSARYLDRQVERAEQFRRIQTSLRKLDEQIIATKVTKLDREATRNNTERDNARENFEKSSTGFSDVEAQIEKLRLEALNFEKASTADYEKLIQLKEKFSELDKEAELSTQRVSLLNNQISEREKDLERIRAKSVAQIETIQQVTETRDKLKQEWTSKKSEIEQKRLEIQSLDSKLATLDSEAISIRIQMEDHQKQAAKDAQKKEMLLTDRVNQEFERATIEADIEASNTEETTLAANLQAEEANLANLVQEAEAIEKGLLLLQDSLDKLLQLEKDLANEKKELQTKFHACDSEIKSLLTLEEHKTGYDLGAQDRKRRTGASLIMDQVSFPPAFQKIGESFLSWFGQIFFDGPQSGDTEEAIRWTYLSAPKTAAQTFTSSLFNLVQGDVPEALKPFLQSIEIVDQFSETEASHIQIDAQGRIRIPVGISFSLQSQGMIRRSETPFGRQSELARFQGEKAELTDALELVEKKITENELANAALLKEMSSLRKALSDIATKRSDLRSQVARIQSDQISTQRRITDLRKKLDVADARIAQLTLDIQAITHSADLQEAEQRLAVISEERGLLQNEKTKLDTAWIESRISFGALEERLDRVEQQSVHVEITQSEYSHNQNLFETDIKTWSEDIQRETSRAAACLAQKETDAQSIKELEFQLGENRQTLNRLRSELEQFETSRREVHQSRDHAQKVLSDLELEHQRLKYEVEELSQLVEVRYHITLQDVLAQVSEKDLERLEDETVLGALEVEAKELREKMEAFGEVNLLALNEFEEINKRLAFMTKQREDLLKTLDALQSIIDRINKITEFRFRETFKAINHNFQFLFPKLFGGGKAFMTLTNEQNLLETGVEIFAEPPGKKVQAMSLLSGGEKAMTSISLLFALFAYRPASFCILDEVDAPLDEVNTSRYNSIVREMSQLSQFIVITHNKRTMEVAETLFGVTMQDPGVSQIVGVQLQEARAFVASA